MKKVGGILLILIGVITFIRAIIDVFSGNVMGVIGLLFGLGILFIGYSLFIAKPKSTPRAQNIQRQNRFDQPQPATQTKVFTFRVVGISYKKKEVNALVKDIKDYTDPSEMWGGYSNSEIKEADDEKFYQFDLERFYDVELVPEPSNPHDKDAITVEVEGYSIGYVPRENTAFVRKIIKNAKSVSGTLLGGKYKIYDGESVSIQSDNYGFEIEIEY